MFFFEHLRLYTVCDRLTTFLFCQRRVEGSTPSGRINLIWLFDFFVNFCCCSCFPIRFQDHIRRLRFSHSLQLDYARRESNPRHVVGNDV
jgi:hypothetical protein